MKTTTNVNPLILNYMEPENPKVFSAEEMTVVYDPKSQITFFMGGAPSRPTRSYDGHKMTRQKDNGGYNEHNDAEKWTDD